MKTLTDLNDFITPSQACIKPVEQTNGVKPLDLELPPPKYKLIRADHTTKSPRRLKSSKSVNGAKRKLETAQISLNDCLACSCGSACISGCVSGCITSAESVLITLQSHTEVLNFLAHNPDPLCDNTKLASLAPPSPPAARTRGLPQPATCAGILHARARVQTCLRHDIRKAHRIA
ncbi:Cytosolic Fe-S cluster assembly factor NAR1 [Grifola frondosa]|uniref:Cytosolic Fe-S cluster assembly factor NAR1 n=1 Tax=Grifola frondosa TaxID=5627 RepID=A0A1C7LWS3_GRIFR|nr:Cytosolic Fe-S cluster assembly factor NAR1 [Grifola frondosa]